jgi:hypothetical protein
MPALNAKEKVKKGELKVEAIEYMQRGGTGITVMSRVRRKQNGCHPISKFTLIFRNYADGGYKKEQSASI